MLLVGDIGGTKTALALMSQEVGVKRPLREATFPSNEFESLEAIIRQFSQGEELNGAVFGVAGPVVQGRAQITNLPWVIDAASLQAAFGLAQVRLLNDLESIAYAVPYLADDEVAVLNEGVADPTGAMGIVAPGTGLGEAFLTWNGRSYQAHPTEGGHTSFGPNNLLELDLLAYLLPRFGHVSYERVCCGLGIPNLYAFLRDTGRFEEPYWLKEELESGNPTPIIVNNALAGKSAICTAVLDLFVEILGSEAGNLALKVLGTGGIYLGGGIPPRILPHLQKPGFMEAFKRHGRFAEMLARVPVKVILDPKAALHGAAQAGFEVLGWPTNHHA